MLYACYDLLIQLLGPLDNNWGFALGPAGDGSHYSQSPAFATSLSSQRGYIAPDRIFLYTSLCVSFFPCASFACV